MKQIRYWQTGLAFNRWTRQNRVMLRVSLLLILFALQPVLPTYAIDSLPLQASTHIYRTPQNPYNSGKVSLDNLQNNIEELTPFHWYYVKFKGNSGWINAKKTLNPIDFSTEVLLKQKALLRKVPNLHTNPLGQILPSRTIYTILENKGAWLKIETPKKETFWIESSFFTPTSTFPQTAITLNDAILTKSYTSRQVLTPLNAKTPLQILKFRKKGVDVQFGKLSGFITYSQVLLPNVFAQKVITTTNDSLSIKKSLDSFFLIKDKRKLPFNYIKKLSFKENQTITINPETVLYKAPNINSPYKQTIPQGQVLTVLKKQKNLWAKSTIKGHGTVWWKSQPTIHSTSKYSNNLLKQQTNKRKYNFEELIRKELYDIASSPKIPNLKFLSANGIYRSLNGNIFEKIHFFKDKNHPIAFTKNGHIFIGPYKSSDHGETFEQYIDWRKLFSSLQQHYRYSSRNYFNKEKKNQLQIIGISPVSTNIINLRLNYQKDQLLLQTDLSQNTWTVLGLNL